MLKYEVMIIGTKLAKSYTGETIFEDVSFKLGNGNKVGLVGANGCGKTTLFKLIADQEEFDSGSLHNDECSIGYIPQVFTFPAISLGVYLHKFLEHDWESYKIDMLLNKLNYHNYDPDQNLSTLSDGQKMKLKMIEVLLPEPTTLLIDEPTNHLDIEGIQWFENYIKNINESVALISHDRQFLNNVVDEIWEIEKKHILRFVGSYDDYKEEKFKLIEKQGREYKIFLQKKASLDRLLQNARRKSDGKARGRAVGAAKKRIIRETQGDQEKTKYTEGQMEKVIFQTDITHKRLMIGFKNVTKKYEVKNI